MTSDSQKLPDQSGHTSRFPAVPSIMVSELGIRRFRNISSIDWSPSPNINVIDGENGAGKTSLLEAIAIVLNADSFRGARVEDLVLQTEAPSEQSSFVAAKVSPRGETSFPPSVLRAAFSAVGARRFLVNDKKPKSIAHMAHEFPLVVFSASDLEIATKEPGGRRRWMDLILSKIVEGYSSWLRDYERALKSRNRLLKEDHVVRAAVRAFDSILVSEGIKIVEQRRQLVQELSSECAMTFRQIISDEALLKIGYQPRVASGEEFQQKLDDSYAKDCARGFTGEGPHADDVSLHIRSGSAKAHASQGQQRVIVLSMKLAEFRIRTRREGKRPILLLDDFSSELDKHRNERFLGIVEELDCQSFITTTHRDFVRAPGGFSAVRMSDGAIVL